MLGYLLEGVRAGLVLALLVGPLLVILLQLSLRRGTLAALVAALGIWTGDVLYILATHYGMSGLQRVLDYRYFNEALGSVGGVILVLIAFVMWFRRPPDLDRAREMPNHRSLASAFFQGFAINAFNPFTVVFWSAFSITQVHDRGLSNAEAWLIYCGIMGTIVLTDTLKVLGARKLRELLRPGVVLATQRVGAGLLAAFGVVLVLRVWW